jgi:hypothetical protein
MRRLGLPASTLTPSLLGLALIVSACSDTQRPGGSGGGGGGGSGGAGNKDAQVSTDTGAGAPDAGTTSQPDSGSSTTFDAAGPVDTGVVGGPDSGVPPRPDAGMAPFDGGVLTGDSFNPQQVASQYAAAACAYQTRCQPAFYAFNGSNEQQCVSETTAALLSTFSAYAPLVQAGRSAYSAAGLTQCVQAFQQASCTDGVAPAACESLFRGNRPEGAPCGASIECGTGSFCAAGLGQCGACLRYLAVGDACANAQGQVTGLCPSGSDCYQVGQTDFACVSETVAVGQPCGSADTGICRGVNECIGAQGMLGTCTAPGTQVGATCASDGETGAPCNIFQNLTCTANNTCATVSWVGTGSQCGTAAPTNGCRSGNRCGEMADGAQANTCIALPSPGTACATTRGLCATGSFCDAQGTCDSEVAAGGTCTPDQECTTNNFCINGSCGALFFNAACN